jgi:energy-coupling factor transport system substrate-specific component
VNPIGWVQGLEGATLIAVICGLMFLEEVGVPLPFAPGDLVLAIGGIAIAGGRVNPAMFVGAVAVTIVVGALLGREIFALLGWGRLMRVAEPLHARAALERASSLLQRGGWQAVFTARLIPGLRVHTTQVAGVSQVPRHTYLAGLLPATAVYIAAFVGLGAALGRPVLGLIHEAEHQVLLAVGLVVAVVIIFLLTRAPVRRALASLEAAGWGGPLKFSLDSVGVVLILACLGLNFAGRALAVTFHLPLFLDSVGTVLAGVVAGPWIGGSVGFISNLVTSNTIDPVAAPYSIVSFAVGFAAGLGRYLGWHKRLSGWITLWLVCFTVASVVSTPLNFLMSGGNSGVGVGDSIYTGLSGAHLPRFIAAFIGEAAIDLPDKLITVVAALLIAQGLPEPGVSTAEALDLGEAFTFVVRSPRWVRKLIACAACLLFSWLIVPFFLMLGYLMDVARDVRSGSRELPLWDHRWWKIKDGFKFSIALVVWYLPAIVLAIPGQVVAGVNEATGNPTPGAITSAAGILNTASSVWGLAVLVLEAAIISQYIDRGLGAALNPAGVLRRLRVNLGLTIVIGALVVVLTTIGLIGLAGLGIGVLLTFPYSAYVASYLVGQYARLTDQRADPARTGQALSV